MHEVEELFKDIPCRTRVRISAQAARAFQKFRKKGDPNASFWKKLKECTTKGFEYFQVGDWPQVSPEWDGVFRFGVRDSRFRLIGFFHGVGCSDFIVIDAFRKGGQRLSRSECDRIDAVAEVKRSGDWGCRSVGRIPSNCSMI